MANAIQTHLPPDPRFSNAPRNPAHQKDLEDIRKWTRECQTTIQELVRQVNALTEKTKSLP